MSVDALRFEMARELCDVFGTTLTLPCAGLRHTPDHYGSRHDVVVPQSRHLRHSRRSRRSRLGLDIDGTVIKDRKDRIAS